MLRGFWKAFNNARAIVLAVVVHVLVLGILVVNMEWLDVKPASTPKAAPIQTETVDRKLIEKELARVEQEKKAKEAEAKRKQQELEKEKKQLAELEKKRKQEEQRLQELEKKKKLEARQKKEAEAKRKKELALKKKREEDARKKAEAEAVKKKKLAEQKAAEERKKKQAAEAKKKRQEEERRKLQKEREEAMLLALQEEENQTRIQQIIGLIAADVQNNWRIPPTARKGMQCKMLIRLLPTGEVQMVQITQSSGDKAFDRSAEDAVYRASPLPVSLSSAGSLFNSNFREFNFLFNPRNI